MTRQQQIYYNAVFGAMGALLGWFVAGLLPDGLRGAFFIEAVLIGAGVGCLIGAMIGVMEGAVVTRTVSRAVLGFGLGAGAGLISGAVGMGLGSLGFILTNGGFVGRSIGFVLFGLLLGVANGLINRALKRAAYGLVGGALAGLIGGVVYEGVTQLAFRVLGETDATQTLFGALGLVIVGASLGGITRMAEDVMGRAIDRGLLIVRSGPRTGYERRVADPVTLGSYDGCQVYLPGDPGIQRRHAQVLKRGKGFVVESIDGTHVAVNQRPVPASGSPLKDHDQIQIGQTQVEFLAR